MPGTVQDLSRKLLNAIDSEGNVTDMGIVLEVVEALEGINITADDIRTNCLGRNINQLRRKLADSDKSLAKRLKKLVKAWQQLIQSQTPNGLTAPSLGGASAANNKTEQPSSDGHQQSNLVDFRKRRKSISFSREGTPSQSSVVGESLAGKSGPPTATATATATATTTATASQNASRTPTPTPSPLPSATPSSSSISSPPSVPQVPLVSVPPAPQPQVAAIIPRPTKAQDFARNRIRRMQMLAHISPQSHKQPPPPSSAASTSSPMTTEDQQKQQDESKLRPELDQLQSGTPTSQSLSSSSKQQTPSAPSTESSHNSSMKAPNFTSQSEHSSASNFVLNGSHIKAAAISDNLSSSKLSQSSASVKFMNVHSRSAPSLSQMVTNSFNHKPTPSSSTNEFHSFTPSSNSLPQTAIAHKTGVKGSLEKNSHNRLDTPPPPESLIIRIPRSHIDVSPRNCEAQRLYHNFGTESARSSSQALASEDEFSLIVSIDLSLLCGVSNSQQQKASGGLDVKPSRTEWFVGNRQPPALSVKMEPATITCSNAGFDEPMETEPTMSFGNGGISHLPLGPGPRLVPSGASPGVDGCVGNDGYWYSWTETIPGHDVAVTVLPYIYIDDDTQEESDLSQNFTN